MRKSQWFWVLAAFTLLSFPSILSSMDGDEEAEEAVTKTEDEINVEEDLELVPIMDMLVEHGSLNKMAEYLVKSGISKEFQEGGPYTIFVPDDSSFSALPNKKLMRLTSDRQYLRKVMARHIIKGKALIFDDSGIITVETLWGEEITIKISEEDVQVGKASVIEEEIVCSNGMVHVIDAVLIPNKED